MITNTYVPYCYDIAHILGLPENLSHRFRYHSRWLKLSDETSKFKGQPGVVVLREFETGEFIPIRFIEIEDVLTVGDINYIEFQVQKYFSLSKLKIFSELLNEALATQGCKNEKGKELDCLVLEVEWNSFADNDDALNGSEHSKWYELLQNIGDFPCYKNYGFLKTLQLQRNTIFSSAVQQVTQ